MFHSQVEASRSFVDGFVFPACRIERLICSIKKLIKIPLRLSEHIHDNIHLFYPQFVAVQFQQPD